MQKWIPCLEFSSLTQLHAVESCPNKSLSPKSSPENVFAYYFLKNNNKKIQIQTNRNHQKTKTWADLGFFYVLDPGG